MKKLCRVDLGREKGFPYLSLCVGEAKFEPSESRKYYYHEVLHVTEMSLMRVYFSAIESHRNRKTAKARSLLDGRLLAFTLSLRNVDIEGHRPGIQSWSPRTDFFV